LVSRSRGRTTYTGLRRYTLHAQSIASVGGVKPVFGADGASPDDRFPLAGTLRLGDAGDLRSGCFGGRPHLFGQFLGLSR
jgi:hypothetical protein